MLNCAIAEGVPREECNQLPTPIDAIDKLQVISAEEFLSLHELLAERIDPGFAVRVGQQMVIDDYGVLGLSWRTCSKVGEIFERSERYFKLLSNTFMWNIQEKGAYSEVFLNREANRRGMELSTEASLSATVVVLQAMSDQKIFPTKVSIKHAPPKDLSSHEKAFQCEMLFYQAHYSITYKTADLNLRTAKADQSINQFLLQRVEEETNGIQLPTDRIYIDVKQLIQDALPSGIPSFTQISEYMGMSQRTLGRRLADHGLTFRDLIRQTQEEVASHLLRRTTRNIAEIAFETGFSEQSAFNRAFKRWTNQSPLEFRKSN